MKHYLAAFLLGWITQFAVAFVFLGGLNFAAWKLATTATVLTGCSLIGANWRSPSRPVPPWWVYLCGCLPVVIGLTIFASIALSFEVQDGHGLSAIPQSTLLAASTAVAVLLIWLGIYAHCRSADQRSAQSVTTDSTKVPPPAP